MPEQHVTAGRLNRSQEVVDVIFPSRHEAAGIVHPDQ